MIEQIIYWSGVAAVLSFLAAVIVFSLGVLFLATKNMLIKNLRSTYRHAQLYFFMKEVMEKGYAQAKSEIGEVDDD